MGPQPMVRSMNMRLRVNRFSNSFKYFRIFIQKFFQLLKSRIGKISFKTTNTANIGGKP